jgi:hypothetical protein
MSENGQGDDLARVHGSDQRLFQAKPVAKAIGPRTGKTRG